MKGVTVSVDATREITQLLIAHPVGPWLSRHGDTRARDGKPDRQHDDAPDSWHFSTSPSTRDARGAEASFGQAYGVER